MSSHQVGKYMAACGFADYEHLFKERGWIFGRELASGKGIYIQQHPRDVWRSPVPF